MNSLLNALSLAQKAGKVATGSKVLDNIRKNRAHLVIIASDASENTKKNISDKAKYYNVKCLVLLDSTTLSQAIGKVQRMYLAIIDENFAQMILSKMKEE